jgi:3-hydroxyacyl-[acyl-carrier-protein] dehydratase
MPGSMIYSMDLVDFSKPLFTLEEIRKWNPQRDEMEQLTAVLYIDREQHGIIGYKEVTHQEFWIRGHMPGYPLMPGVIMCEAAAQLASFYSRKFDILGGDFVGFGGVDNVRFRGSVYPGDRLVIMAKMARCRRGKLAEFDFQGYVGERLVYDGRLIGVPLNRDQLQPAKATQLV